MKPPIYLDYNATTPVDQRVLAAMMPWLTTQFGNPSSRDHAFGWDAAEAVDEARDAVANLINASTHEIVFTGSATESINIALNGLARAHRSREHTIIISPTEHEAVLKTYELIRAQQCSAVRYVPVSSTGHIRLDDLRARLADKQTLVVTLMYANNEIGTMRFPPLFGQVFSANKLMNFGLVSSFRAGVFARWCVPQ